MLQITWYKRVTPISKLCVLREFGSNFEKVEALYELMQDANSIEERTSGRVRYCIM